MKRWMKRWIFLFLIFCTACRNDQLPSSQGTPLLLVEADETGNRLEGSLVDGATLEKNQEKLSLNLGHHFDYTFSPDQKKIAELVWPTGTEHEKGQLHIMDTTTWEAEVHTDIPFHDMAGHLVYHPDVIPLIR